MITVNIVSPTESINLFIISNAWKRFLRALIVNPGNNFEVGILRSIFLLGLGLFASLFRVYLHVLVSQMRAAESVTEIVAIGLFLTKKTLDTLQKVSDPRESLVQQICGDIRSFVASYRELDKVADTPCNLLIFTTEFVPFIEGYLSCGGFQKSVLPNAFLIEILVHFGSYSENWPNWMMFFVLAELILPDLFVNEEIVALLIRILNVGPLKTLTLLQSIHRRRADLLLFEEYHQKIADATLDIFLYSHRNCLDLARQMLRMLPRQFVDPFIDDRTVSTFFLVKDGVRYKIDANEFVNVVLETDGGASNAFWGLTLEMLCVLIDSNSECLIKYQKGFYDSGILVIRVCGEFARLSASGPLKKFIGIFSLPLSARALVLISIIERRAKLDPDLFSLNFISFHPQMS